ncbi:MAG: hypothetical protein IV086_17825 [Hyphomonadaceae bacterium]|nr:hypothetical protein [Hyphomonadaceae bacterium]
MVADLAFYHGFDGVGEQGMEIGVGFAQRSKRAPFECASHPCCLEPGLE